MKREALKELIQIASGAFLSLRYRIHVHGLDKIHRVRRGGGPLLILPNHPAYIDPALVLAALGSLHPRPLVYEANYYNPVLYPFMLVLDAVPVPDLEAASGNARSGAQAAVQAVIDGLRAGRNQILWPAGRLVRDGRERLGGTRSVADILAAVPSTRVVLVRTRGLWGSSFSYAFTGERPNLTATLLANLGCLLANGMLFTPRRDVHITVEAINPAAIPPPRREEINPWLESWYNADLADVGEAPTYVPYHFVLGPRSYEFPKPRGSGHADLSKVKPATREAVLAMLAEKLGRPLSELEARPETSLDALGLDSLDRMELTLAIEQRFGFTGGQSPTDIGQYFLLAEGLVEKGPSQPAPPQWFVSSGRTATAEVLGDTIPAAFVQRALSCGRDVVSADDTSGVLTYERLLVGVRCMARRFAEIVAPNVGVLLPASVAGDITFLALHLAGKLPVMLNWTTGPANLAHAARLTGLTHVVTSKRFVDRTGISVDGVKSLFLEDIRQSVGTLEKLTTLLTVRYRPSAARAWVPTVRPEQPAVVLFTSGSEKAPKAVPLTHANIIANQRAGIAVLGFRQDDVFLGFLPPFHSFGLNATGLMPILGGLKVVRHPDPTDAAGLARKIANYKVTVLVGTPTFVSYILDRAKPGELDTLRMVIVGAEKCPATLRDRCRELVPKAEVLEGYGITECSPVVSTNVIGANKPGTIGKPLPGIEVRVVDLTTEKPLPNGEMGMIWVSGPTVFPGYLGDAPSPFREADGKHWYVTGDLGELDSDGYIRFAGRLKRFIKAGGEMISLPALEEPLTRLFPPTQDGPRVAVEGVEIDGGGRRIVLFTTEDISLREANALLAEAGFRGIMRLDEVRRVEKLPLLGTGKTDYKVLRSQILTPPNVAGAVAAGA